MTSPFIASVEFSKANWFFELFVCWVGLIGVVALLLHTWTYRCWKSAVIGTCVAASIGMLFTPWTSLAEINSTDPDVLLWNLRFRSMAIAWMIISLVAISSLPFAFVLAWRSKRKPRMQKGRQPTGPMGRSVVPFSSSNSVSHDRFGRGGRSSLN